MSLRGKAEAIPEKRDRFVPPEAGLAMTTRAQSIIEYVALIIVIIAVFIAMGAYYKRSLQARYRQAGDVLGAGEQYTPVAVAPSR